MPARWLSFPPHASFAHAGLPWERSIWLQFGLACHYTKGRRAEMSTERPSSWPSIQLMLRSQPIDCTGPTSLIMFIAQSKHYTLHKALRNEERKRSTNFQMCQEKEEKEKKSWMEYFSQFPPPSTKPHPCSPSSMLSSYFRVTLSYLNLTDWLNYWLKWNSSHSCKLLS